MKTSILSPTKAVKALLPHDGGIQEMITTLKTLLKKMCTLKIIYRTNSLFAA